MAKVPPPSPFASGTSGLPEPDRRKAAMKNSSFRFPPILLAAGTVFAFSISALAATPPEGTLNPGSTSPLTWEGFPATVPGGGPAGEATCIDGTNCDVFTIHLSGNASDYAGTQLLIKLQFIAVSDYDL